MAVRKRLFISFFPQDWVSNESKCWHLLVDGQMFKKFVFEQSKTKQSFLIFVMMNQDKIFSGREFSKNVFLIHNYKYFYGS